MASSLHRRQFLYSDTKYSSKSIWKVREELYDWKDVLLPLVNLLKWEEPYYPFITLCASTIYFMIPLYFEMSMLTTVSLTCMLVAIFDYVFPLLRPVVSEYMMWTDIDEMEFLIVCETVEGFRRDVLDTWQGLKALRQEHALFFLLIVLLFLATTAWLGTLVDDFLLTYLTVNGLLLIPGMYHHRVGQRYKELVATFFNKLN
ncbi:hypothetical protein BsWGS_20722 [Bradybaena similaris]